jgi:hypothetical protein
VVAVRRGVDEAEGFELADGAGAGARGECGECCEFGERGAGDGDAAFWVDVGEEDQEELGGVGGEFWEEVLGEHGGLLLIHCGDLS